MLVFDSTETGRNRSLVRALVSRRYFASSPEEIAKRNYANDLSEYNTAVNSVTAQRRFIFPPWFVLLIVFRTWGDPIWMWWDIEIENSFAMIIYTWLLHWSMLKYMINLFFFG